jgi:hypothetical protein
VSLIAALEILGWRAKHFPYVHFRWGRLGAALGFDELRLARRDLEAYDAFADTPVIGCYKQLDLEFPGSKFILTTRDKEAWLGSCERFPRFGASYKPDRQVLALRRRIYGVDRYDRTAFSLAYDRHVADVRQYLRDRPDDLLELDVCGGEGWERLCPFLGLEQPDVPFPWRNTGADVLAASGSAGSGR